jgi:hypothetical protein
MLNLVAPPCKEANTSAEIGKAASFFKTILYQKQAKELPGRSLRIAEWRLHPSIVSVSLESI